MNELRQRAESLQKALDDKTAQHYAESALVPALMEEARIVQTNPDEQLHFCSFNNKGPRNEMRAALKLLSERGVPYDEARNRAIIHVREAHGLDGRTGKPLQKKT